MCGIAGAIVNNKDFDFKSILSRIKQRGPDDTGVFSFGPLQLGHQRLSIQDLSEKGHQPMSFQDGRYVIIFNGEIYNHWELRKPLEAKYSFRSTSDTETLLYGLIEYGIEFVKKLNGIFAFAFFDRETGKLLLVRDHFGVKPLYYYIKNGEFLFASEIKALKEYKALDKTLDNRALINYLNFLYCPGERTLFKYVKKLMPGHWMELSLDDPSNYKIGNYYKLPFTGNYDITDQQQAISELDKQLRSAIKRQLLSDVEVGFFLSGGLDSSLLTVLASEYTDKPLNCFTIVSDEVNKEGFASDIDYARKIAGQFNFNLHEIDARVPIADTFDDFVYKLDEPLADPAPINVYNICKQASLDQIKVLIGGTAGDDIFSGYRRHQALKYDWFFGFTPGVVGRQIQGVVKKAGVSNPRIRRLNKFLRGAGMNTDRRHAELFSWIEFNTLQGLLSDGVKSEVGHYHPSDYLINRLGEIPGEKSHLNKLLFWEFCGFLPDHNLSYTDKMSMASGVEVRVPYLDLELVNFSSRLHPDLKMKGTTTKYVLKKYAEKYLDHDVIYRPKTGFGAPVRQWITTDLDDMIQERLTGTNQVFNELFNIDHVSELVKLNKQGDIDASYTIWSMLTIDSWLRQYA